MILSVPDEGYSRNASCALYKIYTVFFPGSISLLVDYYCPRVSSTQWSVVCGLLDIFVVEIYIIIIKTKIIPPQAYVNMVDFGHSG